MKQMLCFHTSLDGRGTVGATQHCNAAASVKTAGLGHVNTQTRRAISGVTTRVRATPLSHVAHNDVLSAAETVCMQCAWPAIHTSHGTTAN